MDTRGVIFCSEEINPSPKKKSFGISKNRKSKGRTCLPSNIIHTYNNNVFILKISFHRTNNAQRHQVLIVEKKILRRNAKKKQTKKKFF